MYSYRLTPSERQRLHSWLRRRGRSTAELETMTPLVEARYDLRRRVQRILLIGIGVAVAVLVGWSFGPWSPEAEDRAAETDLVAIGGMYLLVYAAVIVSLWYQRRGDQRIGDQLRHRVARATAVDLPTVLGGAFPVAGGLTYGGGLLVGGAAVSFTTGPDRTVGLAFLAAVVLFAALGLVVLIDVARRPAIAEDDRSMAADDTMRRHDAIHVLAPYLLALALIAGVGSRTGWLLAAYLGYAAATGAATFAWWWSLTQARRQQVSRA